MQKVNEAVVQIVESEHGFELQVVIEGGRRFRMPREGRLPIARKLYGRPMLEVKPIKGGAVMERSSPSDSWHKVSSWEIV